jgi:hypothetical protein
MKAKSISGIYRTIGLPTDLYKWVTEKARKKGMTFTGWLRQMLIEQREQEFKDKQTQA